MARHARKSSVPTSSAHLWKAHRRGWAVVLVMLMASTIVIKDNATHLQLSVLTKPEHAAFDGTFFPIQTVPDWLEITSSEEDLLYSEFPDSKLVEIPSYDPDRLKLDYEALEWGDDYDDYTRQMKLTYPVPYAGTYELDGIEGAGSHPGIDIKALKGTPVYSVMNGVVDRVSYSGSGFGNLIVLEHQDVPTLENESASTTLYSGYAHLDTILVTEGEVVSKGQMIGTVGDTGTATTPHLHFQMDNSEAPWHLYWPFTTAESNAVGGFFEAVNEGIGQENVYAYTVNAMDYVQVYLDPSDVPTTGEVVEESTSEESVVIETEEVIEEESVTTEATTTSESDEDDLPFEAFEVDAPSYVAPRAQTTVLISLVDERGELIRMPSFNTPIKVKVSDSSIVEVFPTQFDKNNFSTGEASMNLVGLKAGEVDITLSFGSSVTFDFNVMVTDSVKPVAEFAFEVEEEFAAGGTYVVAIIALDADGQRVPEVDLDESLRLEVVQGQGSFSSDTLLESDFEAGIATVWFTPTASDEVILKASAGEIEGVSGILTPSLFTDLSKAHPYYQAIEYLKETSVIQGYPDQTFRPENPVSRVEALKLIYAGLDLEVIEGVDLSFPDTSSSEWYSPYIAAAQKAGIVKGYPDGSFKPTNEVNRVEFIKMLVEAMGIDVDPVVIGDPYEDVNYLDWYAPYAQFVKETNIAPWSEGTLDPSAPMTRSEVAEMIYRVLAVQQNEADTYSRTLVLN